MFRHASHGDCPRCGQSPPHPEFTSHDLLQLRLAFEFLPPHDCLVTCQHVLTVLYGDVIPPHRDGIVEFVLDDFPCTTLRAVWDLVKPRQCYDFAGSVAAARVWTRKERACLTEALETASRRTHPLGDDGD